MDATPSGYVPFWLQSGLVTVVLGSVLAIGSVHVTVMLVVAAAATALGVATLWNYGLPLRRLPAPAAVLLGLTLYTFLQAAPVPLSFLPRSAATVWQHALAPLDLAPPRFASFSLDPGATWLEAAKWWTYAIVFVVAAVVGRRRGAGWGATLVLVCAALTSLLTIGHGAFDALRVYGFYEPRFGGRRWHVGPLINPNNLAGYLNLGALCGVGLLVADRPTFPRWVLALLVAATVGGCVIAGSRGGLVALVAGLFIFYLLRKADANARSRALVGVAAVTGGVALAFLASNQSTASAFLDNDAQKLQVISWARPMMAAHRLFGIGRGAFESVSPEYWIGVNDVVYSHPENFVIQWISEWGLPVGFVGLALLAWTLRPAALGALVNAPAAGATAGLAALALQNLVDLSSEVPGIMIAAVVCAGSAWGAALDARSAAASGGGSRSSTRQQLAISAAAVGVALLTAATALGLHSITADRDFIRGKVPVDPPDPARTSEFRTALREVVLRHPAEPYFPRLAAIVAMRQKTKDALPWLQRALERGPSSGRTNFAVATYLAQRGLREQGLLELRFATQLSPALTVHGARLAVAMTTDVNLLRRAVPEGSEGARMLFELAETLPNALDREKDGLLEEAARRDPRDTESRELLLRRSLAGLERTEPRCDREGERQVCLDRALLASRELRALEPADLDVLLFHARALLAAGRAEQAAKELSRQCDTFHPRWECLKMWLVAVAPAGDSATLQRVIREMESDRCKGPHTCAEVHTLVGDTVAAAGNAATAKTYYEKAVREEPTPARWKKVLGDTRADSKDERPPKPLFVPDPTGLSQSIDLEVMKARAAKKK